jgi:hypothetical protein
MNTELKISICGDVCTECPRYIATETNNREALEKIAELWYRLGFRTSVLSPDELKCTGCSKDKLCSHHLTDCEHLHHINNCGECDYFPCHKINAVFEKTDQTSKICKIKCSDNEYNELSRAFLMKRYILTDIHEKIRKNVSEHNKI